MKLPIKNCPGYYITDDGRVYSIKQKHRWLKPNINKGYYAVNLYTSGILHTKKIHRLVLETFIGLCPKGMEACHNNDIKTDNRLENLRWDTKNNNTYDAIKHKKHPDNKGENNSHSLLKEKDIKTIFDLRFNLGWYQKDIANLFGVSQGHISNILRKAKWKCVSKV